MDRNIIYAKKLSELGDKIINISNKFSGVTLDDVSFEKLKYQYDNYLKAVNEYKECKISLSDIIPPSSVRIEHEKMVDAIQLFIEGTEFMFNSINIDNLSVDRERMDKGFLMQKLGEKSIVELSDEIGTKLIE